MKKIMSLLLLLLTLMATSISAFAQSNDAGGACAILGCGAYIVFMVVFLAAVVIIDVLIIKWIKKDATAKGMPNADSIKWLGLLNWLGAVIYLLMRPKPTVQP